MNLLKLKSINDLTHSFSLKVVGTNPNGENK